MLEHGLASSIDVEAAASLAAAALRSHPSNDYVQKSASRLSGLLLEYRSTPLVAGASPERATLARVAELKGRRDFASLVHDMDAFPECEELQRAGCDAIDDIIRDGGTPEEAAATSAVACVVRALDVFPYSADTQRSCLAVLGNLIVLEAAAHRAGSAGAVRLAVHAVRSFPDDAFVIYNALHVLRNVSFEGQFRPEALKMGSVALGVAAWRRYFVLSVVWSLLTLTLCRYV